MRISLFYHIGFDGRWAQLKTTCTNIRRKVGVLISGSGTNLQALIEHCNRSSSSAQIVLVISNKPDAEGLQKASKAGIPTKVSFLFYFLLPRMFLLSNFRKVNAIVKANCQGHV